MPEAEESSSVTGSGPGFTSRTRCPATARRHRRFDTVGGRAYIQRNPSAKVSKAHEGGLTGGPGWSGSCGGRRGDLPHRRGSLSGGIEIVLPTPAVVDREDLKVYISGAVREPGVYEASPGHRLEDVVNMAGGPSDDADLDAINLATRVKDEDHWHTPRIGE